MATSDNDQLIPQGALERILDSIHRGLCCLVVGPRFRGKSELVRNAAEILQKSGFYRIAYLNMRDIAPIESQEFYNTLYRNIHSCLPNGVAGASPDIYSASDFSNAMLDLMACMDVNLLVQIDDLEFAPPNLISLLLGSLRSIFTTVANLPGPRFQVIISGTVNLHQLSLRGVSRFESISELVFVDDMTLAEAGSLAINLFAQRSVHIPEDILHTLLEQTSTDPTLIKALANACIERALSLSPAVMSSEILTDALTAVRKQKNSFEIVEALSLIEGDPELLSCYLVIAQNNEMQVSELPLLVADRPNSLDLCGVFYRKNNTYSIKSPLWRSILEEHFTSAHCGQLYAIAGYWNGAIDYYQKAIHIDRIDKKSDLFGVTINGMHASENNISAMDILARGLHACYPECEIGIYLRTESILQLTHYFSSAKAANDQLQQEIQLEQYASPEVDALEGPDYSKISVKGKTRFLIPLRVHSGAVSTGLISFCGRLSQLDLYEQHEEILQLINFLHQAARAIDGRRKYSNALEDAKLHTRTLEGLDSILTSVLNHLELDEEIIFRFLLAGLTAKEGLGFNRAALFLFDSTEKELIGTMGVGHLSWSDADWDWKNLSYETLEELQAALIVPDYKYTPLHAAVRSIRFSLKKESIFGLAQRSGNAQKKRRATIQWVQDLPDAFLNVIIPADEYAVAPLTAGTRRLGFVYVDNKFTRRPIDDFQLASLTGFLTQATLVMEMARSLRMERDQSRTLSYLLEMEKMINNRITHSIQAVLDEVARSARNLMKADSTVAFSLKRTSQELDGYYEVDRIARANTRTLPMGTPNSREGMVKWILIDGQVHVNDIQTAPSFDDGYHPSQSKFLKKEGICSFIGLRLGAQDKPEGVIFINWSASHSLGQNELTILGVFAAFVTAAISSAKRHERLRDDLQKRTQELQSLSKLIDASLDSRPDGELDNLIRDTMETLRDVTKAPIVRLYVLESRDHLREYRLTRGGHLASRTLTRLRNIPVNVAIENGEKFMEKLISGRANGEATDWLAPSSRARLAVPLMKDKNRLGAFYLETPKADLFLSDAEGQEFIPYLADRLAITYYQTEIYNSLRRLLEISIMLKPDFELKQLIQALVQGAVDAMPSISAVTLYFLNQETGQYELGHMVGVRQKEKVRRFTNTAGGILERLLKRGRPIFADFTELDPDLYSPFATREGVKSTAAMPLEVGDERLGYIFFNFRRQYYFDETKQGLLRLFAQIASIAIHRANLRMDVIRRQNRLAAVTQITPLIARVNPDITEVYRTVLRETQNAIPRAHNVCIVERESSGIGDQRREDKLVLKPPSEEFYHATRVSTLHEFQMGKTRDRGIASRVIEKQKAEIVPDVQADDAYFRAIRSTRSEMCVPIEGTEQAIVLESNQKNAFTAEDMELVEVLATHVSVALNNERQFRAQGERQTRERVAQMATGIIHDVNNLISNIPDVVTELRSELVGANDKDVIGELLDDLQNSADSTHRISNRLREFIVGRDFKPVPNDMGQLIQRVIKDLEPHKPVHIRVEYFQSGPLPKLDLDQLSVEQLFSNLLYNAFEALSTTREGRVQISSWYDQGMVWVAVQDNGIGIPEASLSKIFLPGFTTKDAHNRLHGIGLYFCQQVVLMHRGEIKAYSIPGTETTFTVALPVETNPKEGYSLAKFS